jgi:hypothetical protein
VQDEVIDVALNELIKFYQKNLDWKKERSEEIKQRQGAWTLLHLVNMQCLSASKVLRALCKVESSKRRIAFELLVWGREQRLLWLKNQEIEADLSDIEFDENVPMPVENRLWSLIHHRLIQYGTIHPLLLKHWLCDLPNPRLLFAKHFFDRYGVNGWDYFTESSVRSELSQGEPELSEEQKNKFIDLLS